MCSLSALSEACLLYTSNPGSVSIPKDGTHSYGIYEGGAFRHVIMEIGRAHV